MTNKNLFLVSSDIYQQPNDIYQQEEKLTQVTTSIEVPTNNLISSLSIQQSIPTPYDYFALLPALITALTPLVLGLRKNKPSKQDKGDKENQKETDLDH
ncbi:hypothetical protein [Nostoc favosum]|uniref:Uncharacterized protein n=1 Tax=Nostoc favosum CHAB5714 TaxID=2780399 RepID=A0ABS8IKT7_9NOSO|nr:hypothetical protein [Nostoc favosum]MCC5604812.1 hypothetical protein [Nostoc favosum CHAB5714]